jgi:hypothetical protein
MFDLVGINRLLNFISIIVFMASGIILVIKEIHYTNIVGFVYVLITFPALCFFLLSEKKVNNTIKINNAFNYIYGIILFHMGIFFICLNQYTLGSGLFMLCMSVYNIFMGLFNQTPGEVHYIRVGVDGGDDSSTE